MKIFCRSACLLLLPLCAVAAFEQKSVGAEAVALGNAVAAWRACPFAVYNNPAAISAKPGLRVSLAYRTFFGLPGIGQTNLSTAFLISSLPVAAAVSRFGNNLYQELQFHGGVCFKTAHHLYFGCAVQYQHLIIRKAGETGTWGLNLGILYDIAERLTLGTYVTNINTPVVGINRERIPQLFAMGFSYSPLPDLSINFEMCREFRYKVDYRMGFLVRPLEEIGFMFGFEDGTSTLSTGLNAAVKNMDIAYALSVHPVIGISHIFSVSMEFNQ